MFLKSSFSVSQTSGFVAFDGGGAADADVRRDAAKAPAVVGTPRLEPELLRTAQPAVEVAVIVAICAYFAAGLAGVAGWF